ncbi:MAG: hypothetical protein H6551_00355 [Chitinophagales bacterium]|nr:hypothetical protein [Chitinophagaceae bacterium]MCB9063572.1 hypothetical protein [Chitinophagales bacterium]
MFANDIALTIIVTTLLILLLIAGVVITIIMANRRHVRQEMEMVRMKVDYEKELRVVENEVQEQVLTNVARDLHDNIGQLLTLIRIQLEQEKLDDETLAVKLQPVDSTLNDTIDQVRLLSHSLNTEYLEGKSLMYAIDKEVDRVTKLNRLTVHWKHDNADDVLSNGDRIMLFRIFQEIVSNCLKYSGAKNLYIELLTAEKLQLRVADDGVGFDLEKTIEEGKGSGLQNMLKRTRLVEMELDIRSTPGNGTIFTLSQQ